MGRIDTRYYGGKLCPVCGTDSKGCSATDDGLQLCRAPDSDINPDVWVKLKDAGGYGCYRRKAELDANSRRGFYERPRRPKVKPAPGSASAKAKRRYSDDADSPPPDWPNLTRSFTAELTPSRRTELARSLGVPTEATYLITDLGYIHKSPCVLDGKPIDPGHWTFPETDATGTPIGVLRRWRKGMNPYGEDKQQMKGGHRGLSIPRGWRENDGPFVCFEGPTDTLTAAHAGLAAVGRASNNSGAELLAELLTLTEWPADRPVIIAGENDARPSKKNPDKTDHPGRDGALAVARKLAEILRRPVQVAFPPADAKDVRDWLTSPDRGDTPWRERGRQLLEHLTATAETIDPPASPESPPGGQDNARHSKTGLSAEESAGAAADEVLELLTPTCWCRRVRPQIVERISNGKLGVVPFGCHKTSCPTCGMFKKRELFESTETYLPRVTSEDESVGGMTLYCGVVDVGDEHAAQRHIRDYNGEYLTVLTDEAADCMDRIAPQPAAVILRHADDTGNTCLKMTGVAIAAVLPRNAPPPPGFLPASVATAFRFIGTALRHTPAPAEGTRRYRPWRASHGWGDPLVKEPGDIQVKGPVKFSHDETAEILAELKLLVPFWFGDPTVQGKPLGIGGTPAQSLSVSLLLGGVGRDAADMPERDDLVTRAAEWVKYLAKSDLANVGGGSNVYGVIREYLWSGPVGRHDQIRDELLEANASDEEEDRVGEEFREDITAFVQHALSERWVGDLLMKGHMRVAAGESVRKVRREVFAEAQGRWANDTSFLMDLFRDRVEAVFMGRVRKAVATGKAEVGRKAQVATGSEGVNTDQATAA